MLRIAERSLEETPLVVVDIETTGLSPGLDRVVEISLIRLEPGAEPELLIDTMLHPERAMAGTEIHGIRDADVRGAPTFSQIASDFLAACSGAVLVSYNVYFDLRFLRFELARSGHPFDVPHLCAMYMRPLLGLGKRCTLAAACREASIDLVRGHWAAADAIGTTELLQFYQGVLRTRGVTHFEQLRSGKNYKFLKSLELPLPEFPATALDGPRLSRALQDGADASDGATWAVREYQDIVGVLLAEGDLGAAELNSAAAERTRLGLTDGQVRAVHARVFGAALNLCADDEFVDDDEVAFLRHLSESLRRLGWAPGW